MENQNLESEDEKKAPVSSRLFTLEMLMFTFAVLSGFILLWALLSQRQSLGVLVGAGLAFTFSLVVVIRLLMDPDSVRAHQTDSNLKLASTTLSYMKDGLNEAAAGKVCELLLPSTAAVAVAITGKARILGYAGLEREHNPVGSEIKTHATHATLADGQVRILFSPDEIGFPTETRIRAAIIVPLTIGSRVEGTLKFYFRRPQQISETQKSLAQGFGTLLSTQMAAAALEQQTKLATSMELKALQSQINPHFLFNTINTIASFCRTDPEKARVLLREFAVFYRRTLEDSADLILFERELEQTQRYFAFEVARFGEERVCMEVDVDPAVKDMLLPPFLIQPLVENAVRHAMPSEGKLTVCVIGRTRGDDVLISVKDDGVGMTDEARASILHPQSSKGLGIAVNNVNERIKGCYGSGAHMEVESELGEGTTVTLVLPGAALPRDVGGTEESEPERS